MANCNEMPGPQRCMARNAHRVVGRLSARLFGRGEP